ncbi:SAM-dependent methyltransferase [Povalibacter uvarum]|uniref:SAM-dependent methyltransferase n=1 Tax=Povalibacter uvarum TaxID=732238 RepID=A0A841HSZ4_9GAMM|nr:amidohydrolase family protein [Povalibacter uvarum]MBB6095122.1 SAM-dependent methyltransferase [Povalibacter uvarum]
MHDAGVDRRSFLSASVSLLLCGSAGAGGANPVAAAKTYAFEKAAWFDGHAFRAGAFYSVGGVLTFDRPGKVDEFVDLRGGYVVPPFAEAHNHNIEPRPKLAEVIRRYLTDGIFYVKVPANPPRAKVALQDLINKRDSIDVVFSNGCLTATGGHPMPLGQRNLERSGRAEDWAEGRFYFTIDGVEDLERKWPQVLESKPDFIKVLLQYSEEYGLRHANPLFNDWSGLNPAIVPLVVERAHAAGLRVSCHIETAADFHNALVAGVDEINHMPGLRPDRNDWVDVQIERYRISKADAELAARSGTVVVTTFVTAIARIDKANAGEAFREWRELLIWNLRVLKEAGVALAVGSDRYSDTAVAEAFALHSLGVFSNSELLRMWCDTSARTIFPGRKIGALREGYEASFLVLSGNPLSDFNAVRGIGRRFKQGQFIEM